MISNVCLLLVLIIVAAPLFPQIKHYRALSKLLRIAFDSTVEQRLNDEAYFNLREIAVTERKKTGLFRIPIAVISVILIAIFWGFTYANIPLPIPLLALMACILAPMIHYGVTFNSYPKWQQALAHLLSTTVATINLEACSKRLDEIHAEIATIESHNPRLPEDELALLELHREMINVLLVGDELVTKNSIKSEQT